VAPDLIISSPANRTAMTARIIAAKINYPLEKIRYSETIYEFSEDALIHVIKQLDNSVNKAMVVGHNPATNGLANYIGDQPISNIPTCGIYCVDLDISSWAKICENCGKLKFFEFPKKHTS
jgi:phosphohistidine phosphatase